MRLPTPSKMSSLPDPFSLRRCEIGVVARGALEAVGAIPHEFGVGSRVKVNHLSSALHRQRVRRNEELREQQQQQQQQQHAGDSAPSSEERPDDDDDARQDAGLPTLQCGAAIPRYRSTWAE